jgi:hypothetical protein
MRTQRGSRKIKLLLHHSFRQPVKIRVEPAPPRSADWIIPPLPVGALLLTTRRPAPLPRPRVRLIRLEPAHQADWRIVGDHELMLQEESEAACL